MTTLGELRDRILRVLGNPEADGIEEALILDAIGSAYDAILPWQPRLLKTTIVADGATSSFALPADFYTPEAVILVSTGEILPRAVFSPMNYYGASVSVTNTWIISPTGFISFAKVPESNLDLYYCAQWTRPTANTQTQSVLEVPEFLMTAISYYAASCVLAPDSIGVSSLGAYKTKVDSGNPEHNPVEEAIGFLLNLFNQEMNRHPKHQKAQT